MRTDQIYDVIVLGVGGMGSSSCYHLAKRGVKVLGLEQFQIGHDMGSSHGETRIIRKAYFEHADYIPLLSRSYELWDEIEKISSEKLVNKCGLVIYGDANDSIVYTGTLSSGKKYGIPLEEMSAQEAIKRWPMYRPKNSQQAIYERDAGFIYPEKAVHTFVSEAKKLGAVFKENDAVFDFAVDRDTVKLKTRENTYLAKKLIIASGSWSSKILSNLCIPLKIKRKFLCWYSAESIHDLLNNVPCFAFHQDNCFFYGFPRLDGNSIKIAEHFEGDIIDSPKEKNMVEISELLKNKLNNFIKAHLPFVSTKLLKTERCLYTNTPDEHFILDVHPQYSNIAIAAGFSGHGFKFVPVIGEVMADLMLNDGKAKLPIDFLRFNRF